VRQIDSWLDRAVGDLGFYAGASPLSRMIIDAEKVLNPPTPTHQWVPSHVFVFGPQMGQVTEAWLDLHESSVAAVHPESKYSGAFQAGKLQIWRPNGGPELGQKAVLRCVQKYKSMHYGVLDLVGFEIETAAEFFFGDKIENPVRWSYVCSQLGLLTLRERNEIMSPAPPEPWAGVIDLASCSPDSLLWACEEHRGH
jgi:hypothetical protein